MRYGATKQSYNIPKLVHFFLASLFLGEKEFIFSCYYRDVQTTQKVIPYPNIHSSWRSLAQIGHLSNHVVWKINEIT